jgi:hypothetical protein
MRRDRVGSPADWPEGPNQAPHKSEWKKMPGGSCIIAIPQGRSPTAGLLQLQRENDVEYGFVANRRSAAGRGLMFPLLNSCFGGLVQQG